MRREDAKSRGINRTVTQLPFPASLRALPTSMCLTVFGNEAAAVRFFLAGAWFAGGGTN